MKGLIFRKLSAALVVLSLTITMASCGKPTDTTAVTPTTTQKVGEPNTVETTAPAATVDTDPFGKYEPAITLTSVKMTNSSFKYPAGQNVENNMWTEETKNTLGIDLKFDWSADESQYENKLNINIASGDIPDFFMCLPQQFMNLAKADQITDLTEVYQTYGSAEFKASMDAFPEGFESSKIDDKIMGLSIQGFGILAGQYLWIRDDWMQKYKLTPPKTMDELEEIAEVFVKNKPDGQANTYGIAVQKSFWSSYHSLLGLANGFHAYPATWIKDGSGNIVYGSILPEMKNALSAFQRWYQKGIISKEFGVSDGNKINEDFISGKVGIISGASWMNMSCGTDLIKKNPDAISRPYELPSADGTPIKSSAGWPVSHYWVVNKSCKYPEAVIKMANNYRKLNNGSMDIYRKFFVAENADEYYKMAPVYTYDPKQTPNEYEQISKALLSKDASLVAPTYLSKYNLSLKWLDSKDPSGYGAYFQVSSEGSFAIGKKMADEGRVILTELRGSATPNYAKVKSTLDKLENETFTNIIMGANVEEEFAKFVDSWKKLGGDDATKEINDTYKK